MKSFSITPDKNGRDSFAIPTPDTVNGRVLAADTAEIITVPEGAKYALFNATADFYCNYSTTATVITDIVNGSGSELNPTLRSVDEDTTISVISESVCNITVCFYS